MFPSIPRIVCSVLFLSILLVTSCERSGITEKAADKQFKDLVLHKREFYIKNQPHLFEGLHFFDSAFRAIDKPGNEDYTLYYTTQDALAHYAERYSLANKYADTLEKILEPRIMHSTPHSRALPIF
jgi:hypothetical protein